MNSSERNWKTCGALNESPSANPKSSLWACFRELRLTSSGIEGCASEGWQWVGRRSGSTVRSDADGSGGLRLRYRAECERAGVAGLRYLGYLSRSISSARAVVRTLAVSILSHLPLPSVPPARSSFKFRGIIYFTIPNSPQHRYHFHPCRSHVHHLHYLHRFYAPASVRPRTPRVSP